mgnify:CR=1|jgi:hypothetical protein
MRDLVNLRYNLDDPDAPSRGQVFSLPAWRHKRWAAARREGLQADALDEALMALRHDFRAAPPKGQEDANARTCFHPQASAPVVPVQKPAKW